MRQTLITLLALVVMNCENRFLVDDPYSELRNLDPDDVLVFNVECQETKTPQAGSQIQTWGPEPHRPEPVAPLPLYMQKVRRHYPLLPWSM